MKSPNILRRKNKTPSLILNEKLLITITSITNDQRIIIVNSLKTLIKAKPLFIHREPNSLHTIRKSKPSIIRRLLNRIFTEKINILSSRHTMFSIDSIGIHSNLNYTLDIINLAQIFDLNYSSYQSLTPS
jgi:hypothetical protein